MLKATNIELSKLIDKVISVINLSFSVDETFSSSL